LSSFGQAEFKDVLAMLHACARGFTVERKKHHFWVYYNGLIFRGMPTGEHGERSPKIQVGIIRQMIRLFGIADCAKEHLPVLQ
jgi:hypothetical protein